jgi:catechol 2,3-dioxygenase-like lactoylglutathione lyase family enzyme
MLKILALDHVVLRVNDAQRSLAFYCDLLGCKLERRVEEAGLIQLRAGSALIDLVPLDGPLGRAGGAPPAKEGRNMDHLCLRVEPFDEAAIRERLVGAGIDAGETARRYGAEGFGPSIYIEDPDGNVIELKGPPERGS